MFTTLASKTLIALAATAAIAAPALADDDYRGQGGDDWVSVSQVVRIAENAGYDVHEVERDDGHFDVEVFQDGQKYELTIHRSTGEILKREHED